MSEPVEHKLPDRTWAGDAIAVRCPWCRDVIDDLAVPIEALQHAHEIDVLTGRGNWLYRNREFDGAACECPRCGRGLLVKFVREHGERSLVVAPQMSKADARFLAEKMGLF